jgi:hypothetical protein
MNEKEKSLIHRRERFEKYSNVTTMKENIRDKRKGKKRKEKDACNSHYNTEIFELSSPIG